jgi:hypothetical protein
MVGNKRIFLKKIYARPINRIKWVRRRGKIDFKRARPFCSCLIGVQGENFRGIDLKVPPSGSEYRKNLISYLIRVKTRISEGRD